MVRSDGETCEQSCGSFPSRASLFASNGSLAEEGEAVDFLRVDIRYTPTSAFETFPWPRPTGEQRDRIGGLARRLIERRQAICAERQIGLTKLYNEVDEGAYEDLAKLHWELDEAVVTPYGWPKSAAPDRADSNARLLDLNRRILAGEVDYDPFN